jgi:nucleotide-binding universal stress UspA family protein
VAHVAWPPEAHRRAHVTGPEALDSLRADVAAAVRAELESQVRETLGDTPVTVDLSMSWGRPDVEILRLAREAEADVVVVGSRRKTWRERFTTPAVAAGVVRNAGVCTVVVPAESDRS